jgi:N-ethylmaleimide reductase
VFGRDFLSNPDLPRRIFEKLPLQAWDWSTFYSGEVGYSDYKTWDELTEAEKEKLRADGKY